MGDNALYNSTPRKLSHPQYILTVVFCQYSVVEQGLSLGNVSHGAAFLNNVEKKYTSRDN